MFPGINPSNTKLFRPTLYTKEGWPDWPSYFHTQKKTTKNKLVDSIKWTTRTSQNIQWCNGHFSLSNFWHSRESDAWTSRFTVHALHVPRLASFDLQGSYALKAPNRRVKVDSIYLAVELGAKWLIKNQHLLVRIIFIWLFSFEKHLEKHQQS